VEAIRKHRDLHVLRVRVSDVNLWMPLSLHRGCSDNRSDYLGHFPVDVLSNKGGADRKLGSIRIRNALDLGWNRQQPQIQAQLRFQWVA
jgi:hypothetical protein